MMKNLVRKLILWALEDEIEIACRNEVLSSPTMSAMLDHIGEQSDKLDKWKEENTVFLDQLRELNLEETVKTVDNLENSFSEHKQEFEEYQRDVGRDYPTSDDVDTSIYEAIRDHVRDLESLEEEFEDLKEKFFEREAEKLLKQLDPRVVFEIPGAEDVIRVWKVSVSASQSYFARSENGFELFSYNESGNYRKEHLPFYEINFNEVQNEQAQRIQKS